MDQILALNLTSSNMPIPAYLHGDDRKAGNGQRHTAFEASYATQSDDFSMPIDSIAVPWAPFKSPQMSINGLAESSCIQKTD